MNLYSISFHTAEPGHLALGKLMDGITQGHHHILVGLLAQDILGNELIFKAVIE